jgi:hypothetical protein
VKIGAKESEFAELRNEMHGEGGFAAVLFDDRNDFVFDEFACRLADKFFLVVQLRIEIDEIHSAEFHHTLLLTAGLCPKVKKKQIPQAQRPGLELPG